MAKTRDMVTENTIIKELSNLGTVHRDFPLSEITSYKTGGPADILIYPGHSGLVPEISLIAREFSLDLTVIGGATNLLVGDLGIRGMVICLCEDGMNTSRLELDSEGLICSDASVKKDRFIEFAIQSGFSGLEFMAGIPGCMGGGIMMNAGTDMGCFVDILDSVDIVTAEGNARTLKSGEISARYRNFDAGDGTIVLGARVKLPEGGDPQQERRRVKELISGRWSKHPMNYPSAGSVFKNPEGYSSWKLVNDAGLKGVSIGGAMVSEKHTNFIINRGNATSADILSLIEHVQEEVYKHFRVSLETEVRKLGEF